MTWFGSGRSTTSKMDLDSGVECRGAEAIFGSAIETLSNPYAGPFATFVFGARPAATNRQSHWVSGQRNENKTVRHHGVPHLGVPYLGLAAFPVLASEHADPAGPLRHWRRRRNSAFACHVLRRATNRSQISRWSKILNFCDLPDQAGSAHRPDRLRSLSRFDLYLQTNERFSAGRTTENHALTGSQSSAATRGKWR